MKSQMVRTRKGRSVLAHGHLNKNVLDMFTGQVEAITKLAVPQQGLQKSHRLLTLNISENVLLQTTYFTLTLATRC